MLLSERNKQKDRERACTKGTGFCICIKQKRVCMLDQNRNALKAYFDIWDDCMGSAVCHDNKNDLEGQG